MTFAEFDPDDDYAPEELPYDDYLTVQAFLEMHFGRELGNRVYSKLLKQARRAAEDVGGLPGLVFNDEGGEFVSFSDEPEEEWEFFAEGDD